MTPPDVSGRKPANPAPSRPEGERRPVAVIVGATSKWQGDGGMTVMVHGAPLSVEALPAGMRWGLGGALAQKFADEGYFVVLTTRTARNAQSLETAIHQQGGGCMTVELDLSSAESVNRAFAQIRATVGDPEVVIYNAGSALGRELPPEMELLEHMPLDIFDAVHHIAARGPFLVAKEVLPAMRKAGRGSLMFSNNPTALRGRKRKTGQSFYYPRVMSRSLAQALTEEYSPLGVHVASVIIDGYIDSPGTRVMLGEGGRRPLPSATLVDPMRIAETFYYLHTQDRSCWTHEIQVTPFDSTPAY